MAHQQEFQGKALNFLFAGKNMLSVEELYYDETG